MSETLTPEGVHVYSVNPDLAIRFEKLVARFPQLWEDTGTIKISPDLQMKIPLIKGWQNHKLSTRPYPLSKKDRNFLDQTYDALHKQGQLEWVNEPTPFAQPVFVI